MKKLIGILLLVVVLCAFIPNITTTADADVITQASSVHGSDFTNSTALANKLDAIFSGQASVYSNPGCTNLVNTALGTYSVPNNGVLQYVGAYGGGALNSGTSCWIYANGVYYALFGEALGNGTPGYNSRLINLSAGTSCQLTYQNMCLWGVRNGVGAQIRVGTHSLIVLRYDSQQLVYLDGNGDGNGLVAVRTETWAQVQSGYNTRGAVQYIIQPTDSYMDSLYPGHQKSPITYATITEGNYVLKNKGTGKYAVVENNIDVCGQNILSGTNREGFAITKSTTTEGYAVRPLCSVGGMMNVYTDHVSSGNNVCLWDNTGHVSQRWCFEEVSGGYVIRSVQVPSCVLDVADNGNVCVTTYSGAQSQIWVLEAFCASHKYAAATCTKPKTCKTCGATSGSKLGHTYTSACDKTCNRCNTSRTVPGHTYKSVTTKATLTKNGKINYKCTTCGYIASTSKTIFRANSFKLSTSAYTYNGKVRTPSVTVKDSAGNTLKKDTDYTVKYESRRKNAGTYDVTIQMKGKYSGKRILSFKINPINISKCTVKLSATKYTYTGSTKKPTVTVKYANGMKLTNGTHYTVSYASGRKNVGTYKVTIKMKGNYSGTKVLTFKIIPRAASVNKLTAKTKALTVKLNRSLKQSTGYQIQYSTSMNFKSAKTITLTNYQISTKTISGLKAKTTYFVRVRTYKTVSGVKYYSNWSAYRYEKTK